MTRSQTMYMNRSFFNSSFYAYFLFFFSKLNGTRNERNKKMLRINIHSGFDLWPVTFIVIPTDFIQCAPFARHSSHCNQINRERKRERMRKTRKDRYSIHSQTLFNPQSSWNYYYEYICLFFFRIWKNVKKLNYLLGALPVFFFFWYFTMKPSHFRWLRTEWISKETDFQGSYKWKEQNNWWRKTWSEQWAAYRMHECDRLIWVIRFFFSFSLFGTSSKAFILSFD